MIQTSLSFPIGEWQHPNEVSAEQVQRGITTIAAFPDAVDKLVNGLLVEQKNWRYRPEGWTVKQVVHHCADSHMNSLIRFKLALTEEDPTIRPYEEDRWALLVDSQEDDLSDSITLLRALHRKWTLLLRSLSETDLQRTFVHPATNERLRLDQNIDNYGWHCAHHLAHIEQALNAKGRYN